MPVSSIPEFYDRLPNHERIIVDVLRSFVLKAGNGYCREKLSFNVPFFYRNKGICIIWPSAIPRGGLKEGVLFGFWYGALLEDTRHYLKRGSNKRVYYKIYNNPEDIEFVHLEVLMEKAIALDRSWPVRS